MPGSVLIELGTASNDNGDGTRTRMKLAIWRRCWPSAGAVSCRDAVDHPGFF